LPCKEPCNLCRGDANKCVSCLQDQPLKYEFVYQCYQVCPKNTIPDDKNMRCLGCSSDCLKCDIVDRDICYICDNSLLLHETKCVAACPDGFRPNFDDTKCEPEGEIKYIQFPLIILAILAGVIAVGGQYSSKNVFGLHRKMLSFYAMVGIIDALAMWAQFVLTFL
jgi:hypothetical protein